MIISKKKKTLKTLKTWGDVINLSSDRFPAAANKRVWRYVNKNKSLHEEDNGIMTIHRQSQ